MTDMNDANRYPDGTPILVRYPRSQTEEQGDREQWPRLRRVVQQSGLVAGVRGFPRGRRRRRWHARAGWDAG